MKVLKLSYIWLPNFKETLIFHLIKSVSKKEVKIVHPSKCDLLIIGPGDVFSLKRNLFNRLKKKFFPNIESYFPNLDIYSLKRKIKPIRVSFATESVRNNFINSDFSISSDMGVFGSNHLRFPYWKDHLDWSHEGIFRSINEGNAQRFGSYHRIDDLMEPQGNTFLQKKDTCIFSSHLDEPRKSIYLQFSKNFKVDGYGPYFNKKLFNHNSSSFKKYEVMKNYSFNLCPENTIYPGCYSEKVTDAFVGKCLPISCMDNNVNEDFNEKAFVNLNNFFFDNFVSIMNLLKDPSFLKKFTSEPLLKKKPNLEKEKIFINKILSSL